MNLDELERLAEAATPGPWKQEYSGGHYAESVTAAKPRGGTITVARIGSGPKRRADDAAHIAACSPDAILRLLAVVRAADAMELRCDDAELVHQYRAARAAMDEVKP